MCNWTEDQYFLSCNLIIMSSRHYWSVVIQSYSWCKCMYYNWTVKSLFFGKPNHSLDLFIQLDKFWAWTNGWNYPRFQVLVIGLVPNSRWGQLYMTEEIDAMGATGFYFDHDASKFKISITCIKIDEGEWRRDLIHLTNYPLEKYWLINIALLLDS